MYYARQDNYEGTGHRLYRAPAEICCDIKGIRERIENATERLNLSQLLDGFMSLGTEEWCVRLSDAVLDVRETADLLESLNESLIMLTEELSEVRRVTGC